MTIKNLLRFSKLSRAGLSVLLVILLTGSVSTRAQAVSTNPQPTMDEERSRNPQSPAVLHVYFRDFEERDLLANELAAEEASTLDGYLTVIGDGDLYARLLARDLRVEVDHPRTVELGSLYATAYATAQPASIGMAGAFIAPATQNLELKTQNSTFYGGYRTVVGLEASMDQLVTTYPDLVEKVDIGDSWCKTHPGQCVAPVPYGGHNLFVLHITNRAIAGPKPVFWFDAGIHSREVATPEVAMRFVSYLLDGYNTDPDAHWLVDYHDIWVMPMFNPDGHFIIEQGGVGAGGSPLGQRKNADRDDGCTVYPPTEIIQFGTDLNRNFPFKWGCCKGSSLGTCEQTYRGPAEASEEETQAVIGKIRQLVPDQRGEGDTAAAPITATGVYQNLHSFADLNLYPWGWTGRPAPNGADLENIAAHMSAEDAGGNGYDYCQAPDCLYVSDGTASDWGYGELGMVSMTTELGGGSFFPLYSEVGSLWETNRGMFLHLAKIARTPYLLTRGPDVSSVTASLDPVEQGSPTQLTTSINYDWEGNAYKQDVAAAEYYIDTPPWAGGTALPMAPSDGTLDSSTESFAATLETKGLAPGRHIVYVRGRGATDYGGLQSWGPVSAAWLVVAAPGTSPSALEGLDRRPTGARPGR